MLALVFHFALMAILMVRQPWPLLADFTPLQTAPSADPLFGREPPGNTLTIITIITPLHVPFDLAARAEWMV
jgi:hypothetical protein